MKLPELKETKFNKRVGKATKVIRVYTTKNKGLMYFVKEGQVYYYMASPYFFFTPCGHGWPALVSFHAKICGVEMVK